MDEVMIERIFSEIDALAQSVTKLSEIVHKDSVLLQVVHKVVFCVIVAMITGAISFGWYQLQTAAPVQQSQVIIQQENTK